MSEMRDKVVFEWKGKWYAVDKSFKERKLKYILLPDRTLLEHAGYYLTVVLLSYAEYADSFKEVSYNKNNSSEKVMNDYNALSAVEIEEQIIADDETGY